MHDNAVAPEEDGVEWFRPASFAGTSRIRFGGSVVEPHSQRSRRSPEAMFSWGPSLAAGRLPCGSMVSCSEIERDVFVLRFPFYDQDIGVVIGTDGVLVVDTRSTHEQGREISREIRKLTRLPVRAVVNTHFHYDHTFGNRVFRPAAIWGHERCAERLVTLGERMRSSMIIEAPGLADELKGVVIDPPDITFKERALVHRVGREIELRYMGRGHTDNDIVVLIHDTDVVFAGDLLENGATPYFGDAYPIDWPATADALVALATGPVVPGHGEVGDRAFVQRQASEFHALAQLARRVADGEVGFDDALAASPYPRSASREPLERALGQLAGSLDG
jgi:glyoxylase-like metal-dependent hydrolase (beta-lactamase superfamily II)